MIQVMKGQMKSKRHQLFLVRKERERCSGSETSRLYQLSNPGYLGGGGVKDTSVIQYLMDEIYRVNLQQADPKLRMLRGAEEMAFSYCSCVLFPETFIHQHEVCIETFTQTILLPSHKMMNTVVVYFEGDLKTEKNSSSTDP